MSAVFVYVDWGLQGWVGLDIENPAKGLRIFVEFALGFEGLDID